MHPDRGWKPTKFVHTSRGWRGSRDDHELSTGSRLIADRIVRAYESAIVGHARGALLDLGCGKAPLYGIYGPLVDSVVRADRESSLHGTAFIDVPVDLETPLPFHDRQFDTIVATDVLEHLADPVLFWREVSRTLAPGGHLVLGVPFLYWLHEEPHDHYRFTRFRLERFCREHGLDVVLLETYGGSVAVVLDIIGKHLRPRPVAALYQWIAARVLRVMDPLDRVTSAKFPAGYVLVARRTSAAPAGDAAP